MTMTTNTTINILITVFLSHLKQMFFSAEFGTGFLGSGVNSGFFTTPSTASKKNHSNLQQKIQNTKKLGQPKQTNAGKWMIVTQKNVGE